ncbi:hypothetical protein D3C72_2453480 [compost metagenome]
MGSWPARSEIETVEVHDLGPCFGEVLDELFLGIACGIELGDRTQLRVGTKYQVDWRG